MKFYILIQERKPTGTSAYNSLARLYHVTLLSTRESGALGGHGVMTPCFHYREHGVPSLVGKLRYLNAEWPKKKKK